MQELISIDKIIKEAKKQGIDFGKGDPYNRLRYYTKIGWLPHMVRKADKKGNIVGHYPVWILPLLIEIEKLKEAGFSNEEIDVKVQKKNKLQNIKNIVKTKDFRIQIVSYVSLIILFLIFTSELGVIDLGKSKDQMRNLGIETLSNEIIDSGTALFPKNQKKVFVKTPKAVNSRKIYITFTKDYSPATRFWVSNIKDYEGFTLELDSQVSDNVEFNWWVSY